MLRPEPEPRAIGMLFSFLLNISESCFTLLRLCRPSFSALYLQVIIWFLHFFHVILLIALRDWPPVSKCHFQILGIRHSLASFEPDVPPSITLVPTWMPGTHIWRMGAIPWERENCNLGTHFKKIDPSSINIFVAVNITHLQPQTDTWWLQHYLSNGQFLPPLNSFRSSVKNNWLWVLILFLASLFYIVDVFITICINTTFSASH